MPVPFELEEDLKKATKRAQDILTALAAIDDRLQSGTIEDLLLHAYHAAGGVRFFLEQSIKNLRGK